MPTNPWTGSFSAGTKISTGLQLALDTIRERRLGRPAVLLVSDLDDDVGDRERLTSTALSFRRLGIPVRVVGLNPPPEDERYMERLLRRPTDLSPAALPGEDESGGNDVRLRCSWRRWPPPRRSRLRELLVTRAGARMRRSRLGLAALRSRSPSCSLAARVGCERGAATRTLGCGPPSPPTTRRPAPAAASTTA